MMKSAATPVKYKTLILYTNEQTGQPIGPYVDFKRTDNCHIIIMHSYTTDGVLFCVEKSPEYRFLHISTTKSSILGKRLYWSCHRYDRISFDLVVIWLSRSTDATESLNIVDLRQTVRSVCWWESRRKTLETHARAWVSIQKQIGLLSHWEKCRIHMFGSSCSMSWVGLGMHVVSRRHHIIMVNHRFWSIILQWARYKAST